MSEIAFHETDLLELTREDWNYLLYETPNGELLLSVLCGSIAQFDLAILLNSEETQEWQQHGAAFLQSLAAKINGKPEAYLARRVMLDF